MVCLCLGCLRIRVVARAYTGSSGSGVVVGVVICFMSFFSRG